MAYATHKFFQENGFYHIHTPLITASDCEGAGEMFQVTTLLEHAAKAEAEAEKAEAAGNDHAAGNLSGSFRQPQTLPALPQHRPLLPRTPSGHVDYSADFFSKKAFLTVSGQLNAETHACGLGDVYTFGPTFRAEDSHTSRHLVVPHHSHACTCTHTRLCLLFVYTLIVCIHTGRVLDDRA